MKASARLERPREKTQPARRQTKAAPRQKRPAIPTIPGFSPRSEDAVAHFLRGIPPERIVLGAAAVSLVVYIVFALAFPITTWYNRPHADGNATLVNDMGRITGYSPFAAAGFVIAVLVLFACQFLALTGVARVKQNDDAVASRRDMLVQRVVMFAPLAFAAAMLWMQPVTTTDLYGYVARGYLYAQLHLNPMTHKAVLLPGGLPVDRPAAPYGPAWLLVAGLVSRIAGNNLLANMLAFKLIAVACFAGALALVDYLGDKLYPQRRLRNYVLFGWSPLLLFETVGNGHNDIAMVICVLAAFALMLHGRSRAAFTLLVLGALIKYVSVIFIPLWLVYELRRRVRARSESSHAEDVDTEATAQSPAAALVLGLRGWARTAVSTAREVDRGAALWLIASVALIGVGLSALVYAPFWDGFNTFTGLGQQLRPLYYNNSIIGFITGPFVLFVPPVHQAAVDKTVRLVFYAVFGIYTYLQVQRLWLRGPQATVREVITAAAKITFAALVIITFWYQPWYVVWLLPLAALAQEPFVRRQSTMLAAGSLLTYAVGNFLLVQESGLGRDLFVQFFQILITFAPLLLLRSAGSDQDWASIGRRYLGLIGQGFLRRPIVVERVMLVLIVIVAAVLRIVRLGYLFAVATPGSAETSILKQASGDLKLYLSDPQGLHGPFVAVQGLLVRLFGRTPFAALLPSAVIGSITVLMIYLVTSEIMRPAGQTRSRAIALLAALLAATSQWHVSLSRSGMEVVVLPLLLCIAVYALLVALRTGTIDPKRQPVPSAALRKRSRHRRNRAPRMPILVRDPKVERRRVLLFLVAGICTGLACDLAPGLWLAPLVVVGVLLVWHWHRRGAQIAMSSGVLALAGSGIVVGLPMLWHYASRSIGFPVGSDLLARTSVQYNQTTDVLAPAFWQQASRNIGAVLQLLASQDYSAGYPGSSDVHIIPTLLGPFFYIGLLLVIARWRDFSSHALMVLVALPLVASIAVGTPTGVIEAASVLPAMCILPALAIYELASLLGHLPIALDRVNGVRVFSTPEQIGRVLLLVFLLISTIRTFYWYFEATIPAGANRYIPS